MLQTLRNCAISLCLAATALVAQATSANAGPYGDHAQIQSEVNSTNASGSGGWGNVSDFTRPEVNSLKIDDNNQSSFENPSPGAFGVTVAPINVCNSNQTPSPGVCYATPNRVAVTVYYNHVGDTTSDLSQSPGIDTDTVVDLDIALNSAGPLLGWSYASGNPLHWEIQNPGTTSAVLKVKLNPRDVPAYDSNGFESCSRIPVDSCAATAAAADFLQATLLLSLDTTLDAAFKGTLFAGDDVIIGSFEAAPISTPSFTYGVASTHYEDGGVLQRVGSLSGVISDSMLNSYFGLNSSAMSADEISAALPIVRTTDTSGALTASVSWTRWSATVQGTDGWLVKIDNISFSSPKYKVSQGKSRPTGSAKLKSKKVKVAVKISGTAKAACKASGTKCTVKVYKVAGGKLTSLGSKKLPKSGKATVALSKAKVKSKKIAKRTTLAVQIWAKKSGKSTLVSSSIFTVK